MNIKNFNVIVLFALININFIMGCSSGSNTLSVTPDSLNFGNVKLGATVSQDLVVKNEYDYSVKITEITLSNSADFSINVSLPIDLGEDKEITITVSCNPDALGSFEGTMSITHTGSNDAVQVSMSGTCVESAIIGISTRSKDFGNRIALSSTVYGFEIRSNGILDLDITDMQITGPGSSAYSIIVGGTTPVTLAPGTKLLLNLQFIPPSVGTFDAQIEFSHNGANEDNPLIFTITGVGY